MSNLPNSIIRVVPPALRGGYCPESFGELAETLIGGTSAQHDFDRGTTFYNFGNQPVFPTPEPPPIVCDYDLLVDLTPTPENFAPLLTWSAENVNNQNIGVTEISFNGDNFPTMRISWMPSVQHLTCPDATTISFLSITNNPDLLTVSAPLATKINGTNTMILRNPLLQSISFPSLIEVDPWFNGRVFEFKNNASLTTIDLGSFIPKSTGMYPRQNADFSGNALSAVSVNHILARFVANPTWGIGGVPGSYFLDLSGGTNSAPTGQGAIDKATLIARGASIYTN